MDSREDLGLVCKNPDRAHIFFFWTTSRGLLPKLARYRKGQRANIQNRDEIDRVIALENVWRNKIGGKRRQ